MTLSFFALTTRGLETIVQTELSKIAGVQIHERAYRRVHGVMDNQPRLLASVRTADDVFLEVATWANMRHTRDMLPEFTERSSELDLQAAIDSIQTVRRMSYPLTFSVTANFVGKRNYNQHEIKAAVATGILRRYPQWSYSEDDGAALLNVRVFIEHQQALVGVRLAKPPLHRRSYKQTSLAGSLKPPVAAAMIQLANLEEGQTLLDPFCGSGTVGIEAAQQGFTAIGGDINAQAIQISQANAANANTKLRLAQWSGQRLPLANDCVQAVVSNLPWGKQITVDAALQSLYQQAYSEMRRVITAEGVLVLLTTLPDLLPDTPTQSFEISVYGQNPHVLVFQ